MMTPTKDYRLQKIRWFVAFMLALVGTHVARHMLGEPAFVASWRLEAKAIGLFALVFALFTLLPQLVDAWSRRADPAGYGAHAKAPFPMFLESVGLCALMAFTSVLVPYREELRDFALEWALAAIVVISVGSLWAANRTSVPAKKDRT